MTDHTTPDKTSAASRQGGLSFDRWLFIGSVILFAASLLTLAAALHVTRQPIASPARPFEAGQTITMGSATISISHISYSGGSPGFTAPAGKRYLTLDFTVHNNSAKSVNVLPATDTYVKDQAGNVVYLTPYALVRPFRAGELPPGEQVAGQLSYLVPKSTPVTFYVDAVWSGGVIPIRVN
jgi:hypothetical protein